MSFRRLPFLLLLAACGAGATTDPAQVDRFVAAYEDECLTVQGDPPAQCACRAERFEEAADLALLAKVAASAAGDGLDAMMEAASEDDAMALVGPMMRAGMACSEVE